LPISWSLVVACWAHNGTAAATSAKAAVANLRGLRQSTVSCRNPQTLAACRTASATCDATHPSALLRARRERPRRRRAAKKRDERAAFHSITSSALACNVSGTVRPSAFAVLLLITSANLVVVTCAPD